MVDSSQNTSPATVSTNGAPAAIGPYCQATIANGLIYTAGQIPLDPNTMDVVEGGIEAQTDRVMRSLEAVLTEAGSSFAQVLKTTCFLTDLGDFAAFNDVYARYMGDARPARSTVQVAALPRGVKVEVECVALVSTTQS